MLMLRRRPERLERTGLRVVTVRLPQYFHLEIISTHLHFFVLDHFYVFNRPPPSTQPTRISTASLSPETSLVQELLTKEGQEVDPVVVIGSERSGLRLSFDTNQSGVQFYSNNLTVAEKGARKKIHGGSGAVGDGYTPGSTSSPHSSYSYTH